eukprot:TRINITY_DN19424_c0_g1_i1.p2 TRINITY_DN19424_c0_g1~~TRINITY_DN19424_c0_g1_i1.p2  ORF type:complete len:135 (+),score=13.08 TRINITY_DN19424_c0_g1_i1:250-654(+)
MFPLPGFALLPIARAWRPRLGTPRSGVATVEETAMSAQAVAARMPRPLGVMAQLTPAGADAGHKLRGGFGTFRCDRPCGRQGSGGGNRTDAAAIAALAAVARDVCDNGGPTEGSELGDTARTAGGGAMMDSPNR